MNKMNFDKFCGISSILGLILSIIGLFKTDGSLIFVILSLTLIIFIFLSWYFIWHYGKVKKYLDCEDSIRKIHNSLICDYQKIKQQDLNGIIIDLSNICTAISDAFEIVKNTKIGVCIKYVNGEYNNPYVKTLCRDSHSYNQRKELDELEDEDYIMQNTDFAHIFKLIGQRVKHNKLFYCQNRLANKHQYNNTHLRDIELPSGLFDYYNRRRKWPLPYKSTVVVPFLSSNGSHLDGFLCIDSSNSDCFIEGMDVAILQQIALFMQELINYVCVNHLRNN